MSIREYFSMLKTWKILCAQNEIGTFFTVICDPLLVRFWASPKSDQAVDRIICQQILKVKRPTWRGFSSPHCKAKPCLVKVLVQTQGNCEMIEVHKEARAFTNPFTEDFIELETTEYSPNNG
jgi:hypothetical protein